MNIKARSLSASQVPVAIGISALLVWAHYLPSVWPLPPRNNLPIDLQWSLWWETTVPTGLGFVAAVLAIRSIRYWQLAVLITSGFFVVSVLPDLVGDLWQAAFSGALPVAFQVLHGSSLYYLLVVPWYHLALVAAVLGYMAFTFKAKAHDQRNAA